MLSITFIKNAMQLYCIIGFVCYSTICINSIFQVGGHDNASHALDTVECYDPILDTWTPVAKMSVAREGVGVGVLNGVLYAVGGKDGSKTLSSVEAYSPSTGVWTAIMDMHKPRRRAGNFSYNNSKLVYETFFFLF